MLTTHRVADKVIKVIGGTHRYTDVKLAGFLVPARYAKLKKKIYQLYYLCVISYIEN